MAQVQAENDSQQLTVSSASRECTKRGLPLAEASVRRATDTGELPAERTPTGVRLIRLGDLKEFVRARLAS
jgi:hypothetical protein